MVVDGQLVGNKIANGEIRNFYMIWYDGNSNYLLKFGQLVGNKIVNAYTMWYDMIEFDNSKFLTWYDMMEIRII